jgi:hypothetical protein
MVEYFCPFLVSVSDSVYTLVFSPQKLQLSHFNPLQENKNDIVGNKILHCGQLMDMFNKFYKEHGQNEPRCELSCNWNTNNCQKWVLSWRLGLKCDNCNFCGEKTKVHVPCKIC